MSISTHWASSHRWSRRWSPLRSLSACGDFLFAGTGKQTLTGLDGEDHFVFDKGATRATITDFEPGVDTLEFRLAGKFDWHDVHISSVRGNTVVSVGDDRIELIGVRPYELHKQDFLFDF